MKSILKSLTLAMVVAFALPASAKAQDICDTVNKIINSGLDRRNPFAAVAGLTLPNADDCTVYRDDPSDQQNTFACDWGKDNYNKLDELDDKADELDDKEIELLKEWVLMDYDDPDKDMTERQYDAAKRQHDAAEKEYKNLDRKVRQANKKSAGELYSAIYQCISDGAVDNAEQYITETKEKTYRSDGRFFYVRHYFRSESGGCEIKIMGSDDVNFIIYCPNPNYQASQ